MIKISSPKNQKMMKAAEKSTAKSFTVDKKSTMISPQSPETRYQPAPLILNPKNINIDQL